MAAKLVIEEDPNVMIEDLMRDIAEGFVKGNHTMEEFLYMLEEVGKRIFAEPN